MKTIFSVVLLIVYGVIANFITVFILNIAGLSGALLAGTPGKRSQGRFVFGSIISTLGQAFVYLSFVAFVVNWTRLAGARGDVFGPILWPFAFLSVMAPVWLTMVRAREEARENKFASPQVEALPLTTLIALVGFFVFAFFPGLVKLAWRWVPYV
jgi:hypothetical protein